MSATAWPTAPLGEVVAHRKNFIRVDDHQQYKRCRVQLSGRGIVLRDQVLGVDIKTKEQQLCRAGEMLVAEIDAKLGGFGIVPDDLEGAIVSSHYFLFAIDEHKLNRRFLGFYLQTPGFQDQVTARGSTNYAAIRPHHVMDYTIPLPPLEEQNRIVAKLDALAAKIDEGRQLAAAATKEEKHLRESFTSGLLDSFSAKYPMKGLRDLVTVRGGGTPSKSNPTYWSGTIPWITPKDMKKRELSDAIDHISKGATEETAAKLIEPGAVLVVVRGMILVHTMPSAVLLAPAAINQDMKALITRGEVSPEYLCASLWAWNHRILERVEKSTHDTRRLETDALLDFQIPVPPSTTQSSLLDHLKLVSDRTTELSSVRRSQENVLAALLPSLLDRAFRGEM